MADTDKQLFLGPFTKAASISISDLDSSKYPTLLEIPQGLAIEIYEYSTPRINCAEIIKQLLPNTHSIQSFERNVIRVKIARIIKSFQILQHKKLDVDQFLNQPLVISNPRKSLKTQSQTDTPDHAGDTLENENKHLKRKLQVVDHERNSLLVELENSEKRMNILFNILDDINARHARTVADNRSNLKTLASESTQWRAKFVQCCADLDTTTAKVAYLKQKCSTTSRNVNKRIKRRESTITSMQDEKISITHEVNEAYCVINQKDQEISEFASQIDILVAKKNKLQSEKLKLQKQLS